MVTGNLARIACVACIPEADFIFFFLFLFFFLVIGSSNSLADDSMPY